MFAGQHFMQNDPEREQIAPRTGLLPLDLLGRHVGNCSDNLAGNIDNF
jgi:hypothetical protein